MHTSYTDLGPTLLHKVTLILVQLYIAQSIIIHARG